MPYEEHINIWRIDVRGRYLGQDIVNTFNYITSEFSLGASNPDLIKQAFTTGTLPMYSRLLNCMVDSYVATRIIIYRESADRSKRYAAYYPVDDPGAIDEVGLPSQQSAVIIRRSISRDRRTLNGRLFVGCVPATLLTGGRITPGTDYTFALDDLVNVMRHSMGLDIPGTAYFSAYPVISTSRRAVHDPRGIYWGSLTDTLWRSQLGVQRRRAPGHGRRG